MILRSPNLIFHMPLEIGITCTSFIPSTPRIFPGDRLPDWPRPELENCEYSSEADRDPWDAFSAKIFVLSISKLTISNAKKASVARFNAPICCFCNIHGRIAALRFRVSRHVPIAWSKPPFQQQLSAGNPDFFIEIDEFQAKLAQ